MKQFDSTSSFGQGLKLLDLSETGIGDPGVDALLEALEANTVR